jgi:hypothetical protein
MIEEFREVALMPLWLSQQALIQMLWLWIKASLSQELLEKVA